MNTNTLLKFIQGLMIQWGRKGQIKCTYSSLLCFRFFLSSRWPRQNLCSTRSSIICAYIHMSYTIGCDVNLKTNIRQWKFHEVARWVQGLVPRPPWARGLVPQPIWVGGLMPQLPWAQGLASRVVRHHAHAVWISFLLPTASWCKKVKKFG